MEGKLLHHKRSIEYLNRYLELEPNAEDVDFILELIKQMREHN